MTPAYTFGFDDVIPYGRDRPIASIYVTPPGGSETDMTEHLEEWDIDLFLKEMDTASFKFIDVQSAQKLIIKEKSVFKFFLGNTLIMKGIFQEPDYNSFFEVEVQATGMEGELRTFDRPTFATDIPDRDDYKTILTDSNTIFTALVGGTNSTFTEGTNTNFGQIDFFWEFDNMLRACFALAEQTNQDFWVSHSSPTYDDNLMNLGVRGSSNVMTFTTSGSSANASVTKKAINAEQLINDIQVIGAGGIKSRNFHATTVRDNLNGGDTRLNGSVNDSVTTLTVYDTSGFPSSGSVQIGAEKISYTGKTGTTFTGCTRGASSTVASEHDDDDDVVGITSLTVDSTTGFPNTGSDAVWVGAEKISYTGKTATTFTGITRGAGGTPIYAHLDNAEVWDAQYTVSSPQANSSISDNGVKRGTPLKFAYIKHPGELDLIAQDIIANQKDGPVRISLEVMEPDVVLKTVSLGDTITVTDSDADVSGTKKVIGIHYSLTETDGYSLNLELVNRRANVWDDVGKIQDSTSFEERQEQKSVGGGISGGDTSAGNVVVEAMIQSDVVNKTSTNTNFIIGSSTLCQYVIPANKYKKGDKILVFADASMKLQETLNDAEDYDVAAFVRIVQNSGTTNTNERELGGFDYFDGFGENAYTFDKLAGSATIIHGITISSDTDAQNDITITLRGDITMTGLTSGISIWGSLLIVVVRK